MKIKQKTTNVTTVTLFAYLSIYCFAGCAAENTSPSISDYGGPIADRGGTGGVSGSTAGQEITVYDFAGFPATSGTDGQDDRTDQQYQNVDELDEFEACISVVHEATQIEVEVETEVEVEVVVAEPVALYLMLDQSKSMGGTSPLDTINKWQVAVDAINDFVNDSASENLDIALQYFPLQDGGCSGSGFDTPEVPMERLLAHAPNIADSLAAHTPGMASGDSSGGSTNIEGALSGATAFCAQFEQDTATNPEGEKCVAVLVTDGQPTVCSEDPTVLAGIAADAYTDFDVMTFAIGMNGADFSLLDQIAEAGHGDCTPDPADSSWSCNVSTGDTTFIDALNLIRNVVTEMHTITEVHTETKPEALPCEWEIPDPPEGEQFDRNTVNVEFSPTGQDTDKLKFGRVASEADCRDKISWYYDDPDNPARIVACEQSCSLIEASEAGKVDILLGCETLIF